MEARLKTLARRGAMRLITTALVILAALPAWAAGARTQNFIVTAATQDLANEIASSAEAFRRDLAIEWLGKELPNWPQPCPITAQVQPNLGAGGATSFMFSGGKPHGWTMSLQGSRERVLDSVLPHEVTHTIFATHFGRPLPRWADEGACTTVEHQSERGKQERLLYEFLKTNRGIPFNQMFAMKEYPRDILPLYSQGYSLARFLIAISDKPSFTAYVGDGMQSNNWTAATRKHYGFHNLSDLQLTWVEWVRSGTPPIKGPEDVKYVSTEADKSGRTLAEVSGRRVPKNLLAANTVSANTVVASNENSPRRTELEPIVNDDLSLGTAASTESSSNATEGSWYARRRDRAQPSRSEDILLATKAGYEPPPEPRASRVARPQSAERVKQKLLEWDKDGQTLTPAAGNSWR